MRAFPRGDVFWERNHRALTPVLHADIVANILSILLKSTTIDITVWLLGALAEISKITPASRKGAEMIVEMNGITLMAQFLTTSTDGQAGSFAHQFWQPPPLCSALHVLMP